MFPRRFEIEYFAALVFVPQSQNHCYRSFAAIIIIPQFCNASNFMGSRRYIFWGILNCVGGGYIGTDILPIEIEYHFANILTNICRKCGFYTIVNSIFACRYRNFYIIGAVFIIFRTTDKQKQAQQGKKKMFHKIAFAPQDPEQAITKRRKRGPYWFISLRHRQTPGRYKPNPRLAIYRIRIYSQRAVIGLSALFNLAIFKLRYLYASVHVPGFLPGNVTNILQKHFIAIIYAKLLYAEQQGRGYPCP